MLTRLNYTISEDILQAAMDSLTYSKFRQTINEPTGNFFYDPWTLCLEFKDTPWEAILNSLQLPFGEARIIPLAPGTCYQTHADIDDRYHLNITGEHCYLVDLENTQMHKLSNDGQWQSMDAGLLHSAINFGTTTRIQLVVRQLLTRNTLEQPVKVKVFWNDLPYERARSLLDNHVSSWLNRANKNGTITDFSFTLSDITFDVEQHKLEELTQLLPQHFKIEIL